jgi:hypothetical protein
MRTAALLFFILFPLTGALAQYPVPSDQEGRYVLMVVGGANVAYQRSYMVSKTPALVLDRALGVVWHCKNLQDDKPKWVKTDLAKNSDKNRLTRKYILKTLDYFGSEPKVPAVVLDIEEGKVWTASNILDDTVIWVLTDLVQEDKREGSKYRY